METALLKSFATSARTDLIREVAARITAVFAQGSPERVERSNAVSALERAIAGAGGGDKGRAHVADTVAYTWFNRIIALRFMDANGYTGIGVVSPAVDQVGQPEVLAAAKRGQVDKDVIKGTRSAIITGLLNGTRQPRPGVDAQAEAYELLLAGYCRFWNTAMPFMFEREGDYTELLIPANLLADDSVLSRAVVVLTEDVCQDVEVIGWLYQFYISERKDEVFAGFKKNKKAGADEIPAATQLFTPHWIVRYLVENTLGRLWMLNHPSSGLVNRMEYYIAPVDEETDFLKISKPEELEVLDPACGSGHMLTYAFDLLFAIYEEEGYAPSQIPGLILANNLYGTEIDPRAGSLAAFALTMKAAAKRKLFLKNPVEPNVCVIHPISFSPDERDFLVTKGGDEHAEADFWNQFTEADTFGSLVRPDAALTVRLAQHLGTLDDGGDLLRADTLDRAAEVISQAAYLTPRYAVVVANPPYMGLRNMNARLASFARTTYPASKNDLFTMLVERSISLCMRGAKVGVIGFSSWMFLSSFAKYRHEQLARTSLDSLLHIGRGVFGADFGTTAFVLTTSSRTGVRTTFRRLFEKFSLVRTNDELSALVLAGGGSTFTLDQELLKSVPGVPIAYWLSSEARDSFTVLPATAEIGHPKVGMQTANNNLYLRFWWEVSFHDIACPRDPAPRWVTYLKGGPFRRWWGNATHVVWYEGDGSRIRAEPNGTTIELSRADALKLDWTDTTAGSYSLRLAPPMAMHDIKSHCFYPADGDADWLLAFGNSRAFGAYLEILSPGVNFQVGDVGRVPVLPVDRNVLASIATRAVDLAKADWSSSEETPAFAGSAVEVRPADLRDLFAQTSKRWKDSARQMDALQNELDALVDDVAPAGLSSEAAAPSNWLVRDYCGVESEAEAAMARDLVSFAVGCIVGRYSLELPGLILADQGATLEDYFSRIPSPLFMPDADNVVPIVGGDWFEDDIVGLFRQFIRLAFGEQDFEANLNFVTESLGVKGLRDYFISRSGKSTFYDDHVQRYKKRPIYWLFSSPRGSFNALIYMHRYTPSTVSTVLTYLREFVAKLESSLQQAERAGNAKEADRLRKIVVELNEYEHDTLYPKASENVVIDLDDGVSTNYPKFGAALRKIAGLEASGD